MKGLNAPAVWLQVIVSVISLVEVVAVSISEARLKLRELHRESNPAKSTPRPLAMAAVVGLMLLLTVPG